MRKIKPTNLKILGSLFVLVFLFAVVALIVVSLPKQRDIQPKAATQTVNFSGISGDGHLYESGYSYPPTDCSSVSGVDWVGQFATMLGGSVRYEIDRAYIGFNTSSIPDGATINSATLRLKVYTNRTDTDFTLKVMRGNWGGSLSCSDWGVGSTQDGSRSTAYLPSPGSYFDISVSASGINKYGYTYYELTSSREGIAPCCVNGQPYADELFQFYAGSNSILEVTYTTSDPAPTVDIKANGSDGPITIAYNTAATLSWSSTNATSCTASNGWSGSKPTSGSESTGNLTSGKTYTLSCTGGGGSASDSVTVNVSSPPPTVDIKANSSDGPITVNHNSTITLSWTSTNATSCSASGSWSGSKGTSGSESTGALSGPNTYTYTLACTGPGGSASDSVTVNVSSPPPTADIKANGSDGPITINYNTAATISWSSTNATSCSVSPTGWTGLSNTGISTGNLTATTTYTLSCTGAGGSAADSVTVNVARKIGDFNGDGKVNVLDFSKMLTFWGTNEPSCDANNDGVVNVLDFSALLTYWEG